MKTRMRYYHDVAIISAHGRLDAATAPQLRQAIAEQIAAGHVRIVADLQNVTYIDNDGRSLLIDIAKTARQKGGDFRVASAPPRVKTTLHQADGKNVLEIYPNVVAATASYFPWPVSSGEEQE